MPSAASKKGYSCRRRLVYQHYFFEGEFVAPSGTGVIPGEGENFTTWVSADRSFGVPFKVFVRKSALLEPGPNNAERPPHFQQRRTNAVAKMPDYFRLSMKGHPVQGPTGRPQHKPHEVVVRGRIQTSRKRINLARTTRDLAQAAAVVLRTGVSH